MINRPAPHSLSVMQLPFSLILPYVMLLCCATNTHTNTATIITLILKSSPKYHILRSLPGICAAGEQELILVPGLGDKKVKRLYQALHEPFRSVRPKKISSSGSSSGSCSSSSSGNNGSSGSSSSSSSVANTDISISSNINDGSSS